MRKNVGSGAKWEEIFGYSRAVRVDQLIEVSGTVAVDDDGKVVGLGDPYEQTKFIIHKAKQAIESLGAKLEDVIRTRIYVVNIDQWQEIGRAHAEYFGETRPATSMVEVNRLIGEDYLLEIEFKAWIEQ